MNELILANEQIIGNITGIVIEIIFAVFTVGILIKVVWTIFKEL